MAARSFSLLLALAAGCIGGGSKSDDSGDSGASGTVDCEGVEETVPPATIDSPTTWSCTVRLNGDLRVEDTVTLSPCTRVLVGDRIFLQAGGSLVARGTDDCPITFTSGTGTPAAGDWRYISIEDDADNDTVFEHTIFEYGGGDFGMVLGEGGVSVAFRDVVVRHASAKGLEVDDLTVEAFERVSFSDIPSHPVQIHAEDLDAMADISVAETVREPRILAVSATRGAVTQDTTVPALSVPYELLDVRIEADFTLAPGAHVQMRPDSRLQVNDDGNLILDGTAEAPIVWESAAASHAAGDWNEITINNGAGTESAFRHATLRHGGGNGHGVVSVDEDAALTLDSVTFESNGACDVTANGTVTGGDYTLCD